MQFNAVLVKLLDELEVRLRAAQLWQATPPSSQALVSQEPFAVDTLLPHEWLQWIFLPRRIQHRLGILKESLQQQLIHRFFIILTRQ